MIGLIIVSHGKLSQGLLESAELIAGKQENIRVLSFNYGDNLMDLISKVNQLIIEFSVDSEVLVLTDLLGGSPSNATAANMQNLKFRCITGVNLPMLLQAIILRNDDVKLDEIYDEIFKAGKEGINDLEKVLNAVIMQK